MHPEGGHALLQFDHEPVGQQALDRNFLHPGCLAQIPLHFGDAHGQTVVALFDAAVLQHHLAGKPHIAGHIHMPGDEKVAGDRFVIEPEGGRAHSCQYQHRRQQQARQNREAFQAAQALEPAEHPGKEFREADRRKQASFRL